MTDGWLCACMHHQLLSAYIYAPFYLFYPSTDSHSPTYMSTDSHSVYILCVCVNYLILLFLLSLLLTCISLLTGLWHMCDVSDMVWKATQSWQREQWCCLYGRKRAADMRPEAYIQKREIEAQQGQWVPSNKHKYTINSAIHLSVHQPCTHRKSKDRRQPQERRGYKASER